MEKKSKSEIIIDPAQVEKIKTLQSLPEEIVITFLKSKGSVAPTDFKNKFIPDAKQN